MTVDWKSIEHRIYMTCMIQHKDQVLLIKRPGLGVAPSCFFVKKAHVTANTRLGTMRKNVV
jgi:hypothetical protein